MKMYAKMRFGFTMVELMVTILITMLVFAGIGVVMVDSIKSFPKMYERAQGDVITDAYVAKATFDTVCRKASLMKPPGPYFSNSDITVYYYSSMSSTLTVPDRCAKFAFVNNQLTISYGDGAGGNFGNPVTLAKNVQSASFATQGSSVIMTFKIDNIADTAAKQKMKMTVTSCAVRHNR